MKCAKDGCGAYRLHTDIYCFWHSPMTEDARREAGRLGGRGNGALAKELRLWEGNITLLKQLVGRVEVLQGKVASIEKELGLES